MLFGRIFDVKRSLPALDRAAAAAIPEFLGLDSCLSGGTRLIGPGPQQPLMGGYGEAERLRDILAAAR